MTATVNNTNALRSRSVNNANIRRSFDPDRREFSHAVGSNRPICYGDRLFARLVMHGRTVVEFMVNSVNDLTELWGELRRQCRGMRGLAKLYLRNASRGWSLERPLMLYPDRHMAAGTSRSEKITAVFRGEARQLSFPWEF